MTFPFQILQFKSIMFFLSFMKLCEKLGIWE